MAPALAAAFIPCAHAQFSLNAQDIELKELDKHPRSSLLRETKTEIYGTLDLGLVSDAPVPPGRCGPPAASRVAGVGPSLIGLRGAEMLQDGWSASVHLEHGLNAAAGRSANDCGVAFDRALSIGLAHREGGQIELGRRDHPAYGVALRADPWSGNGAASPGDSSYYARPVASDGSSPKGSFFRVRAPQALTYTSPERNWLWLQMQASLSRNAAEPPDPPADVDEREYGAALHLQSGSLHAAVAFQRWNANTKAWPASLTYEFLSGTGHLGVTFGELATGQYRNILIGATFRDQAGSHPGEWRLGLNAHRDPAGSTTWKLGNGRVWPLSRRTQIEADAGLEGPSFNQTRLRVGVGIRHRFSA